MNTETRDAEETMREKLLEELRKELKEEIRRELLGEESEEERTEKDYPWIVFALDGTEYGVNSKFVLSIEIIGDITPIVDAQSHCPGITQSRGDMIDLLDLRALFGLGDYISAKNDTKDDRYMMMVIETGDKKRGVIVDEIVSVEYITNFIDGVVSESDGSITSQYIRQIATREKLNSPVLILNPESLNAL
jgi:purine-binding chemotaxis protein CheW